MLAIRTILHPTDFSEHSANAFGLACALARDYSARLLVLHVVERPVLAYGGVMTPPPPPPSPEAREAAIEKLRRISPADRAIPVEHLCEEGDAATGILQVARERQGDLIVMGSHGRTGLGRLLMGSVAEQVVRRAACPVLIVRAPFQQQGAVEESARQMAAQPAKAGK
jgi:nucleotide-binding universal stress UspA family protein